MKITFYGAAHEVTGSCHHITIGDKKLIVDCGMKQGADAYEKQSIPFAANEIDYVFITHAHIDHSGLLPLLYKQGFKGMVYATEATTALCNIMLRDSAHIQEYEVEWKNRKAKRSGKSEIEPLYTTEDAMGVLEHFIPCAYHEIIQVSDCIQVRFSDAGHLLGSSSVELWLTEDGKEKKIVFSGDIGNPGRPLIKDPEDVAFADYIVIESTYGDRIHEKPTDFAIPLAEIIESTMEKGGNVVIPAFSVGRTQEMLYFIRRIKEEKLMSSHLDFQVYMDSPLAVEATNIFSESVSSCFDEEALELVKRGQNPIGFPGLKVAVSPDESKQINFDTKPKVIISASGMCEAGRVRHHLKHNLWRPESTIVFVGFQVPGTLGSNLLGGAKEVRLFGETIEVNARIAKLPGISGHGDKTKLLDWIKAYDSPVSKIFVVHGDENVVDAFGDTIKAETGIEAYAPYSRDEFDLLTGQQIAEGEKISRAAKTKKAGKASNAFSKLLEAAEALMRLVKSSDGMANKDLDNFREQIEKLIKKWSN